MDSSSAAGVAELQRPPSFLQELRVALSQLEGKDVFMALLGAWIVLFHFLGNSILAYTRSYSLFGWCYSAYNAKESEDSHGALIPFAVLALLWWKRHELLVLPRRPWPPGLIVLGGACGLHFVGYMLQVPHLSVLAFAIGLYSLVGITWGASVMKASFFPFVLLVFCVPLSAFVEPLTIPLRIFSTWVTHLVCHGALGINVVRRGTQLIDPAGKYDFDVVAACSGIRSLVSLGAMTFIFGMVFLKAWWRRSIVFLCAIPIALACNVLRLVCIVLASELFGEKAGHFVHEWFGFVTYIVALGGVMLIAGFLDDKKEVH